MTAVLFFACAVTLCAAATPFGAYDLNVLPPKQNGRHAHRVHAVDDNDRHLHFEYDVQHADGVVLLDHLTNLESMQCTPTGVTLRFSSAVSDAIVPNALIAGGAHWGCLHSSKKRTGIVLRRVTHVKQVSDTELQVATEEAEYHHFFKDGAIKFSTNMFPKDHFTFHHASDANGHATALYQVNDDDAPALALGRKRSLSSWLHRKWSRVVTLGKRVWSTIKTIYTVASSILLSDVGYSHTWTQSIFGINYDGSSDSAKKPISIASGHIVCTNCYAHIDLGLQFEMNITNAQLTHMLVRAIGSSFFNFEAEFHYNSHFTKDDSFIWAHLQSKPIFFSIAGIPFILNLEAPVEIGYSVDIRVASSLSAKATAAGEISYGMLYDSKVGSLKPISSHSWDTHGDLGKLAFQEDGDVDVYLMPQLVILVDKIGGPNFSLHAGLTGSADASTAQCLSAAGLEAHVNFDLEVAVGAVVDVKIGSHKLIDKQWGPNPIFSMTRPVISGCVAFSQNKFRLVPGQMIAGNTWTNTLPIACSTLYNASIALQLLEYDPLAVPTGGMATFGGVFNGHSHQHGACTMQTTYTAHIGWKIGNHQSVQLSAQHAQGISFSQCSDGTATVGPPAYLYGVFDNNSTRLTLTNLQGCPTQVVLQQ